MYTDGRFRWMHGRDQHIVKKLYFDLNINTVRTKGKQTALGG